MATPPHRNTDAAAADEMGATYIEIVFKVCAALRVKRICNQLSRLHEEIIHLPVRTHGHARGCTCMHHPYNEVHLISRSMQHDQHQVRRVTRSTELKGSSDITHPIFLSSSAADKANARTGMPGGAALQMFLCWLQPVAHADYRYTSCFVHIRTIKRTALQAMKHTSEGRRSTIRW